jgi:hypothetical protein
MTINENGSYRQVGATPNLIDGSMTPFPERITTFLQFAENFIPGTDGIDAVDCFLAPDAEPCTKRAILVSKGRFARKGGRIFYWRPELPCEMGGAVGAVLVTRLEIHGHTYGQTRRFFPDESWGAMPKSHIPFFLMERSVPLTRWETVGPYEIGEARL